MYKRKAKYGITDLKGMLFSEDEETLDELNGFADVIKDIPNAQAIELTPLSIKNKRKARI